ncbi:MAG: M48 family metalloprotease [ANME-2 cluster archaeon]|nr:M48 family metalloprotease [ANME-2 cluster archaeon]
MFVSNPDHRITIFASGQVLIISAVWLSFTTMTCNSMFFIDIYLIYTLLTLGIMIFLPRVFDGYLVRHLNAAPITELIGWTQQFVNNLVKGTRVFYFDSAIPKAFAAGRSIFVSVGLLELLNDDELRAVLAHESWHIMHNKKTHWLKQLSLMTFTTTGIMKPELEQMADRYAASITGRGALDSARLKLFPENQSTLNP